MAQVLTLKEFREQTKDLPETTKIVAYTNDMEVRNAIRDASISTINVVPHKEHCRDAFDGTNFTVDTYKRSDEETAEQVIYIRG